MPRVLCVGDSLTVSDDGDGGFRSKINDRVSGLTFVGPYTTGNRVGLSLAHAGYDGRRADQMTTAAASETWMVTYTPDIVFVMAGTNDLRSGTYDATQTIANISALAGALYDARAAKIVILAIPPGSWSGAGNVTAVNAALPGVAYSHRTSGRDVVFFDSCLTLSAPADFSDGTHMNLSGNGEVADELERIMRSIYGDPTL